MRYLYKFGFNMQSHSEKSLCHRPLMCRKYVTVMQHSTFIVSIHRYSLYQHPRGCGWQFALKHPQGKILNSLIILTINKGWHLILIEFFNAQNNTLGPYNWHLLFLAGIKHYTKQTHALQPQETIFPFMSPWCWSL